LITTSLITVKIEDSHLFGNTDLFLTLVVFLLILEENGFFSDLAWEPIESAFTGHRIFGCDLFHASK